MIRDSTSEEQSDADAEEEEGLLSSAGSITELQAAVQSSSRTPQSGRRKGQPGGGGGVCRGGEDINKYAVCPGSVALGIVYGGVSSSNI